MRPIEEICREAVEFVKRNSDLYGTDFSKLECIPRDEDLQQRLMEHLDIPREPKKTFYKRLAAKLFERYGSRH